MQNKNFLEIDNQKNREFKSFSNKDIVIKNFNLSSDWEFLFRFKDIENLRVEDSYIDAEKFYKVLLKLKKVKHLTYNHYCYFTLIKNTNSLNGVNLRSLKKFTLEFPKENEPDFEVNYYVNKSYKDKNNFITDIPHYDKIFINLEEIELLNYETFQKRIYKEENKEDIKKLNKEIYWNTSLKKISSLKNIKNIVIDDGKYETLLKLGLENFLNKNNSIHINGHLRQDDTHLKDIKVLQFFYKDEANHKIISKINPKLFNSGLTHCMNQEYYIDKEKVRFFL